VLLAPALYTAFGGFAALVCSFGAPAEFIVITRTCHDYACLSISRAGDCTTGWGEWARDNGRSVVFAEDLFEGAVAVFGGEFFVHDAIAGVALVKPTAFGEPEGAFHDELHGVDESVARGIAAEEDGQLGIFGRANGTVAEAHHAAGDNGEDNDVVGIQGLACFGVKKVRLAVDGLGDFLEGIGVKDVVGVEVNDVVAGGFADAPVTEGMAPVGVVAIHTAEVDGHRQGGVEEGSVMIGEEFKILVGLVVE
jgi:hypothetical protein